jgi:hypothetical protein
MTPHKKGINIFELELLYNCKHKRARFVIDNCHNPSFGLATKAKGIARVRAKKKPGS